jgi:tripartite motif-containing protein 71
VGYIDGDSGAATVMKYDSENDIWETVGSPYFSVWNIFQMSMFVDRGTPYVAFDDSENGNKATVMKYDSVSDSWVTVGSAGFSAGEAADMSMYVSNGIPYLAYKDGRIYGGGSNGNEGRATVMKFIMTSPELTADTTANDTAHATELTFEDNAAWRGAITAIKDGTTTVTEATYTVSTGKITINAGVLAIGNHTITIMANGYTNATVDQTVNVSTAATLTSIIGTVSTGGTVNETITSIPNGTTLAALKAAITPAANATFEVYDADGTTVATTLATGQKVIVTAQDGITKVTYTVTVNAAPSSDDDSRPGGGGGSTTPTSPSGNIVTSTEGNLTLPTGKTGEVSLGEAVKISIPADASGKELKLTIEKVLNTQQLLTEKDVLASPIYEILKNFSENFSKPVTLTFAFDPASLKSNQKAAVFYFDEASKIWVEVAGGKVNGNNITVDVNHFTKFAVFAVDKVADVPIKEQPTDPKPTINFSDISGHWAEATIKQAVSGGIVSGYPEGTFKPESTVTRAEFAVMLMNALKPQGEGAELTFTDTAKIGTWAQKAVAQAVQAGIINGYADGSFGPNAEVTRAEMAVMIGNAMGQSIEANAVTGFADDGDIPAWAKGSVAYVKQAGIVQGKGDNEFAPQDHATRAEAVTVLLNMLAQKSK